MSCIIAIMVTKPSGLLYKRDNVRCIITALFTPGTRMRACERVRARGVSTHAIMAAASRHGENLASLIKYIVVPVGHLNYARLAQRVSRCV